MLNILQKKVIIKFRWKKDKIKILLLEEIISIKKRKSMRHKKDHFKFKIKVIIIQSNINNKNEFI